MLNAQADQIWVQLLCTHRSSPAHRTHRRLLLALVATCTLSTPVGIRRTPPNMAATAALTATRPHLATAPSSVASRRRRQSALSRGRSSGAASGRARDRVTTVVISNAICGIDLGTTNSAVAIIVDGQPMVIPCEDGHRTVPSIVNFQADGKVLVGHAARKRLAKGGAWQMLLATSEDRDVVRDRQRMPFYSRDEGLTRG